MSVGFGPIYDDGEQICVTDAGDIPARHIGSSRFDLTYQALDERTTPMARVFRVITGRKSEKKRTDSTMRRPS